MLWIKDNIWEAAERMRTEGTVGVVIPTNIGWRADGTNVMGRGLARMAARRYPRLAAQYGAFCAQYGADTPPYRYHCRDGAELILVPSKPLNVKAPQLSWMSLADLDLVRRGLTAIQTCAANMPRKVLVPILGSGNGGLPAKSVVALMREILVDERFIGVIKKAP